MGGRGGSLSASGSYRDEPEKISYKLGADAPAQIRYKSLTGGVPDKIMISGKEVEVVGFKEKANGGPIAVRTDTRPDLKAKADAYTRELSAVREHNAKLFEKRVPGVKQLEAAQKELQRSINENRSSSERARDSSSGRDYKSISSSAQSNVTKLTKKYPKAALYLHARDISLHTPWPDNTGKAAAASEAIEILRKGGSIKQAKAALAKRSGSSY